MTRSNAFYSIAGQLSDALDREQRIKEEIADLEIILKANGGCTVQECRAVKRVLKAKSKGQEAVEKLAEKMSADSEIFDALAYRISDTKNMHEIAAVGQEVIDAAHDPDTGEIIETDTAAADVGLDSAYAVGVSSPQDDSEGQDSFVQRDNPCPPIPENLRGAV